MALLGRSTQTKRITLPSTENLEDNDPAKAFVDIVEDIPVFLGDQIKAKSKEANPQEVYKLLAEEVIKGWTYKVPDENGNETAEMLPITPEHVSKLYQKDFMAIVRALSSGMTEGSKLSTDQKKN